jgi:hypothetical protein
LYLPFELSKEATMRVDPQEFQVLIEAFPYVLAHGDNNDQARRPQGNGKDHSKILPSLPKDLTDAYKQEIM